MDTSYFLAITNMADQYHKLALALSSKYRGPYVTTEAVLMEVGNSLSRRQHREMAVKLIGDVQQDPDIEVVPFTPELFQRAVELYSSRHDKDWGLTDCASFVIMEDRDIHEALTADSHFSEAGYQALMVEGYNP